MKISYKGCTYTVKFGDRIKIAWIQFLLKLKRNKRRCVAFVPNEIGLYFAITLLWIVFGLISYYVGVDYKKPEPYMLKDVAWELKNSCFTSVFLALVITGYSQNVNYKQRLIQQHSFYVYALEEFGYMFKQFIGDEILHYMPFYNEQCLRDTLEFIEDTTDENVFSKKRFKKELRALQGKIDRIEREIKYLPILRMDNQNMEFNLQQARYLLEDALQEKMDYSKANNILHKLSDVFLNIVDELRRPWRQDIENDKKILQILAKYKENDIENHFYYSMHLYGHQFGKIANS